MDVVLEWADNHGLDKAWESLSPEYTRDNLLRQCVSVSASTTHVACNVYYILSIKRVSCPSQLYTLTIIGIFVLYFGMAGGSYYLMCAFPYPFYSTLVYLIADLANSYLSSLPFPVSM